MKKTSAPGFTLLELIVVVALIGIMLVMSVPALQNTLLDDELKAACRKIIGLVSGVRELAVREQQAYFLNIDRSGNRIWFEKDREVQAVAAEETKELPGLDLPVEVRISEIWTRSEGEYSEDQSRIWVSPRGYMDQTILHLTDDDSNIISLHFSPFLGRVEIYDEYTQAPAIE